MRLSKIIGFFIFIFSCCSYENVFAAALCSLGHGGHGGQDVAPSQTAVIQMSAVNNALCGTFSCPQYQLFQTNSTANAMAWDDGTSRYIRYNSNFMNQVQTAYSSYATIGIFGHELGHLIDFRSRNNATSTSREAYADMYAGCAFAIAGEPRSNLIYLAQTLHALGASPGYPTPQQRSQLLKQGYDNCSNN